MKSLVTINFIEHIRNNKVIWRAENIKNIIHLEGREFLVKTAFSNNGSLVPDNYYLGLDARDDLIEEDNLNSLLDEPSGSGYLRQSLSSSGTGFAITSTSGIYKALSNIVTFSASGSGCGTLSSTTSTLIFRLIASKSPMINPVYSATLFVSLFPTN